MQKKKITKFAREWTDNEISLFFFEKIRRNKKILANFRSAALLFNNLRRHRKNDELVHKLSKDALFPFGGNSTPLRSIYTPICQAFISSGNLSVHLRLSLEILSSR